MRRAWARGLVAATTGAAYRRDAKAKATSDFLALAQEHRELWSEAHRRPDLSWIFRTEVDLVATPIATAEQEFLNLVFVHFQTGWQLAKEGVGDTLAVLRTDVRAFFGLPLVRAATFIPTRYLTTILPGPNVAGVLSSQQHEKANSY